MSDVITSVGSLDSRVGDAIRIFVEEDNKLRRGRSKGIMDVDIDKWTGRMDEKHLKVDSTESHMVEVKKVVEARGGALFSLLMQFADVETKKMLMAHARKKAGFDATHCWNSI